MGDETKADKLPEFLADIAVAPEFPALSRSIEQVMLKVEEDASIQHITNVILKDYSLTLRILRTANSALNNRSGRPMRSISQAVMMLGWRPCVRWRPAWSCWSTSGSARRA